MTQSQLKKLALVWQKRLRIQDWSIDVDFVDMERPSIYGGANVQANFHRAEIGINRSIHEGDEQIEETLVHELLHVRFPHFNEEFYEPFAVTDLLGHELEVGIDMVSRALVEGFRK